MNKIKAMKVAALIFPGLTVAVLSLFMIAETVGGDWSGLGHLLQLLPIALLMWVGWKRPLWGGILFLVLSFAAFFTFGDALRGPEWLAPFLIIIAPLLLSGILLLGVAGLERTTN